MHTYKSKISKLSSANKKFKAKESISQNKAVALNDNGTVEMINSIPIAQTMGPDFSSTDIDEMPSESHYNSVKNQIIFPYMRWGEEGVELVIVIGNVINDAINWLPAKVIDVSSQQIKTCYDPIANKLIIAYIDGDKDYCLTVICVELESGNYYKTLAPFSLISIPYIQDIQLVFSNNDELICFFKANDKSYSVGLFVDNLEITGTESSVFLNHSFSVFSSIYDKENKKAYLVYHNNQNNTANCCSCYINTDNEIVFSSPEILNLGYGSQFDLHIDYSEQKFLILYVDALYNKKLSLIQGHITPSNLTFNDPESYNTEQFSVEQYESEYDSELKRLIFVYKQETSQIGVTMSIDVKDAFTYFNDPVPLNRDVFRQITTSFDPINNKIIITYLGEDYSKPKTFIFSPFYMSTNLSRYIGINNKLTLANKDAIITLFGGISNGHSLQISKVYYLHFDGLINTLNFSQYPIKRLGVAISESEILLDSN
jgi:hypothetical protein